MSNELQLFHFQDHPIRVSIVNGETWWVITDACRVLEISNVGNVISRLDKDGIRLADVIDSIGRNQKTAIANEPNLYRIIFRSDKPEAKAFQDWVFNEVLPSIRKTGSYSVPNQIERVYPWTAEAEQLRQLNMKYIQPGFFSISAGVLQKLIYKKLEGIKPNERAKIDISYGNFFPRWLKGERKGQLKDCTISPEHTYDKLNIKKIGHVVDTKTGAIFDVCHYANLYRGDFDNLWDLYYEPVILPVYLGGCLPDGTPRVTQTDIQQIESSQQKKLN